MGKQLCRAHGPAWLLRSAEVTGDGRLPADEVNRGNRASQWSGQVYRFRRKRRLVFS